LRCDGYGQPEPETLFGSGLLGGWAGFRLSELDRSGRVLSSWSWTRDTSSGWPAVSAGVPWLVLVLAAGVSGGLGVAWCGHVPGGRPQLARKSAFGPFDTVVRCVLSGRARYRWATPPDWWGRARTRR
jgi:hypothetical protein